MEQEEGEDKNLIEEQHSRLPSRFSNPRWRIFCAFVTFFSCIIASGPLMTYPTLEPLLIRAAVFKNDPLQLTSLFLLTTGVNACSVFIMGFLYDHQGPRTTGVLGASIVTIGFITISFGIRYQDLNWLLLLAFPITYLAGNLNSFSMYGFIWFFPNHQALVIGIANSCSQLSGSMVYILVLLEKHGVPLYNGMLVIAALTGIAAMSIFPTTPTKEQYLVLSTNNEDRNNEKTLIKLFKEVLNELLKNKEANLLFTFYNIMIYLYIVYTMSIYVPYLQTILPNDNSSLISTFAIGYSLIGSLGSPLLGYVYDKYLITIDKFLLYITSSLSISLFLSFICIGSIFRAHTTIIIISQYLSIIIISLLISSFSLIGPKWAMTYSSPELFGGFFGLQFTACGIVEISISYVIPYLTRLYATGLWYYLAPVFIIFFVWVFTALSLHIYLYKYPTLNYTTPMKIQ